MPMQVGDVYQTYAEVDDLFQVTGHKPVEQGVESLYAGIVASIKCKTLN